MSNQTDYEDLFGSDFGNDDDLFGSEGVDLSGEPTSFSDFGDDDDLDIPEEESGPSRTFVIIGILLAFVFVIIVAIVAALLLSPGEDCDDRCILVTSIVQTNEAIATSVRASETALSIQSTAQEGTRVAEVATSTKVFEQQASATQDTVNTAVAATATQQAVFATATQDAEFMQQTSVALSLTPNVTLTPVPEVTTAAIQGQMVDPTNGEPAGGGILICVFKDDGDGEFDPAQDVVGDCAPQRVRATNTPAAENAQPAATATTAPASPTTAAASPTTAAASPTTAPASPTRAAATPTRFAASPTTAAVTATTAPASPTTAPASPTRVPASATPQQGNVPPTPTPEVSGFDPSIYGAVGRNSITTGNDSAPAQPAPTQETLGEEPTAEGGSIPAQQSPTAAVTAAATATTAPSATVAPAGSGDTLAATVSTDSAGNFVITGLPQGTYWIVVNDQQIPVEVRPEPYVLNVPVAEGQPPITIQVAGSSGVDAPILPTITPEVLETLTSEQMTQTATAFIEIPPGTGGSATMPDTGLFNGEGDDVTATDLLILMLAGGVLIGIVFTARRLRSV